MVGFHEESFQSFTLVKSELILKSPEEGFQSLTHYGRVSRRKFPVFYRGKSLLRRVSSLSLTMVGFHEEGFQSFTLVKSPEEGFQSLTHYGRVSRRRFPVFYPGKVS